MNIIDKVKQLIKIMDESELSEIEIQEEATKIKIKKGNAGYSQTISSPVIPPLYPAKTQHIEQPFAISSEMEGFSEIYSPMVGTFYRANAPGESPCVGVGDFVNEETVVCIIEAMKIMNEVKAEMVGEVVEIYVQDGEAVEYGQPLFRIKQTNKAK
ncbi:MAG: acetyl-CoA carboxylase biotin carboxyl carrier protein [Candidatus Kuenenia sp.]|nr:acetyl-CoA carboxylase biotin carboxyl carrier protein [Candidatus Kuenenia hertensis]